MVQALRTHFLSNTSLEASPENSAKKTRSCKITERTREMMFHGENAYTKISLLLNKKKSFFIILLSLHVNQTSFKAKIPKSI